MNYAPPHVFSEGDIVYYGSDAEPRLVTRIGQARYARLRWILASCGASIGLTGPMNLRRYMQAQYARLRWILGFFQHGTY